MRHRKLHLECLERRQVLAAPVEPFGDAFPVNTTTDDYQEQSAVAVENNGDFVVVWSSWGQDGSQGGIYAQRFQSDGTKLGGEIPVNHVTDGNQGYPDIAVDPASGAFVVTWQHDAQGASDVYARAFNSDGSPVGDQVLINGAPFDHYNPAVAARGGGDFVIAWDSFDATAGSLIHARHFSAANTTEGDEFAPSLGTQNMNADVAAASDGSFVITWQNSDGDGSGIAARRYDSASQPVGLSWQVNAMSDGDQTYPAVATAPNGLFTIAWLSDSTGSTEVVAQRYGTDATPTGAALRVNADTTVQSYPPTLAALGDGSVYLVWTDTNLDVVGRFYYPDGVPDGLPSPVTTADGSQLAPAVAFANSQLVTTWTGEDADRDGVFGQIHLYGAVYTNPINPLDVSGDGYVSPIDALIVITKLNSPGSHIMTGPNTEPPYYDVNADGYVSPIDALIVITYLNNLSLHSMSTYTGTTAPARAGAEGEQDAHLASASADMKRANPPQPASPISASETGETAESRRAANAGSVRTQAEPTMPPQATSTDALLRLQLDTIFTSVDSRSELASASWFDTDVSHDTDAGEAWKAASRQAIETLDLVLTSTSCHSGPSSCRVASQRSPSIGEGTQAALLSSDIESLLLEFGSGFP